MHDMPHRVFPRTLILGILVTVAWMIIAGMAVQHRDGVPSLVAYKSSQANVTACATHDVRALNQCLDDHYASLLSAWRTDTGIAVVLPPALLWVAAFLGNLGSDMGLFRRRQRV